MIRTDFILLCIY